MNTLTYSPDLVASAINRADVPLGATIGRVSAMLRFEAAVVLVGAVLAYRETGASWWLFAGLFLLPDMSMLGYFANRKLGSAFYNAGHTYLGPAAFAALALGQNMPFLLAPVLTWAAHIGSDRLMGYGLKYGTAFGATHLGWKGKKRQTGRSH